MVPVSIVIITKNEAALIYNCIKMACLITSDIIVIDNGSTDNTLKIARQYGCRVYQESWDGYGANKNKGILLAKYNWILSIDADEIADMELVIALHKVSLSNPNVVYDIKFKSYFGNKPIHFGDWGYDHHIRLFNRLLVKWAEPKVHETLILPKGIIKKRLDGHLHHYSVKDITEGNRKAVYYAHLSARQYRDNGKKTNFLKLYLSPIYGFIKNYIVNLGFLDGKEGLDIAIIKFKNTRLKYHYLKQYEQGTAMNSDRQMICQ